jgi:hypothetical protein
MWRPSIAALLAGLALAACGSSQSSSSSSSSSGRRTTAGATVGCAALRPAYVGTNGATGHLEVTFALRNAGTRTCRIEGYPAARLLAADGRPLSVVIRHGRGFFPDTLHGPRPVTLGPGARARVGLSFVTNNEYAGARRCRTFVRAEVRMAGSAWASVSLRGAPRLTPCGNQIVVSPIYG